MAYEYAQIVKGEELNMRFNEDQLTIQRLSDKVADLEAELSEYRSENQELLSMEAYHKGQSRPLRDVIADLEYESDL